MWPYSLIFSERKNIYTVSLFTTLITNFKLLNCMYFIYELTLLIRKHSLMRLHSHWKIRVWIYCTRNRELVLHFMLNFNRNCALLNSSNKFNILMKAFGLLISTSTRQIKLYGNVHYANVQLYSPPAQPVHAVIFWPNKSEYKFLNHSCEKSTGDIVEFHCTVQKQLLQSIREILERDICNYFSYSILF